MTLSNHFNTIFWLNDLLTLMMFQITVQSWYYKLICVNKFRKISHYQYVSNMWKIRTFKLVNSKLHRNHIKHTVLRLCVYFRPNKGVIITDNTYHNIRTFVESHTSFISRKKDFWWDIFFTVSNVLFTPFLIYFEGHKTS